MLDSSKMIRTIFAMVLEYKKKSTKLYKNLSDFEVFKIKVYKDLISEVCMLCCHQKWPLNFFFFSSKQQQQPVSDLISPKVFTRK